jgi:transcriptional regulator with XRE-family HTH domain
MLYISDNLKWLRSKRNLSQQEVADGMHLPVDRYKKYEYGKNTPPAETLLAISRYYYISIDLLLTVDLRKISIENLLQLEDNRIVLPVVVDREGNNLIEIVPHKAQAGYLTGYADVEFMESLQQLTLPFLGPGKFRAFPIDGDSMPPHNNKTFVVGKYIENLSEVRNDKTYILITVSEGITYKRLSKKIRTPLR